MNVIMMTGHPLGEEDGAQPPEGIMGWLEKTIDIEALGKALQETLQGNLVEDAQ